MAVLTTGNTFSNGDQVTASSLNNAVNDAEFAAGAVDNTSTQLSGTNPQQIIVKDLGISRGKIAIDAVGTDQLANDVVISTSGSITGAAGSFTTLTASGDVTFDTDTLKVDSTNNRVGIGTTNPSYLLDVSPTSNGGEIARFKSDTTNAAADVLIVDQDNSSTRAALQVQGNAGSTECLFVGSNGNVGIGTASPTQLLDVNGQARVVGNLFVGTDDTTPNGMIEVYGGGSGQSEGGEIRLRTAADYDPTYNHYFIDAYEDDLRIGREGGADITLTSGGKVGIGTPSPGRLLTVAGDAEFNVVGSSNTSKGIVINSSGTNFESDAGIIQATHAGSGSLTGGYWLKFNANSADRFTVRGDGRTEISSTTGGVILPRMTTTQKNAISSPANGEMVYDTTDNKFYGYANGAWVALH